MILDCRVLQGNPADSTLAKTMVERQADIFCSAATAHCLRWRVCLEAQPERHQRGGGEGCSVLQARWSGDQRHGQERLGVQGAAEVSGGSPGDGRCVGGGGAGQRAGAADAGAGALIARTFQVTCTRSKRYLAKDGRHERRVCAQESPPAGRRLGVWVLPPISPSFRRRTRVVFLARSSCPLPPAWSSYSWSLASIISSSPASAWNESARSGHSVPRRKVIVVASSISPWMAFLLLSWVGSTGIAA